MYVHLCNSMKTWSPRAKRTMRVKPIPSVIPPALTVNSILDDTTAHHIGRMCVIRLTKFARPSTGPCAPTQIRHVASVLER